MKRTEDLGINNLKIIQDSELFCFGTDSVALSDFAKAKQSDTVVDLCTGNGIIPILLSAKTKARKIYGVELQKCSYDLAVENVKINSLDERLAMIHSDISDITDYFPSGSVDVVTCNPPYMSANSGFENPNEPLAIARHEICTNLSGVIDATRKILKFGGRFFMVHRADRLCDIIWELRQAKMEPKRIRFIAPSPEKEPKLVLVEAMKGAMPSLKFEPALYVNL